MVQTQSIKPQNALEMYEQHLDLLAVAARTDERLCLGKIARDGGWNVMLVGRVLSIFAKRTQISTGVSKFVGLFDLPGKPTRSPY
jgi:hypothetical protein